MLKKILLCILFYLGIVNSAFASIETYQVSDNHDVTLTRQEAEQQEQTNKVKNLTKTTRKTFTQGKKKLEEPQGNEPVYTSSSKTNIIRNKNHVVTVNTDISELSLNKGQTKKIFAYTTLRDGTSLTNMRWKSLNKSVVRVDSRGNIKAIGTGKAIIVVHSMTDFSKKKIIKITVKS